MKTGKALIIYGSPRGERSSSAVFGHELVKGLERAGTETIEIRLTEKKINPCTGCYTCWTKTPGSCIFKDDMGSLLPEIVGADLIVHVYPLYHSSMPGIMKNFWDRTLPLSRPELVDKGGTTGHPGRYPGRDPAVFLVCVAGFPEPSHFDALLQLYRQVYGERFVGNLVTGGAEMARQPSFRETWSGLFKQAEQAGFELGLEGRLTDATARALLSESVWPAEKIEAFRETANNYWKSFNPVASGSLDLPGNAKPCKISDGGMSTFLAGMAATYRPEARPELAGIIQFRFEKEGYFLKIENGQCLAYKGIADKPLLTLTCTEELWLSVSEGKTTGEAAVIDGRLKVSGEMGILMTMDRLFGSGGDKGDRAEISGRIEKIPDHRGPLKLPGMVWFNIAFIPWIILWAGNPLFGFLPSRLAAAGAALLLFLYHRLTNRPTLFETGGLFYTLASAAAAWFIPAFFRPTAPVFDQLFMAGLWLSSLAGTFSLTAEYSRLGFPKTIWGQPSFLKTNDILVVVWGIYYIASTVAGVAGLMIPAVTLALQIGGYILLAPMFLFTIWFSGWYPKWMMSREV
jgi:multimeric flavodoxin WrbA/putative sterol carrier protein